jgi:hypothetical protein
MIRHHARGREDPCRRLARTAIGRDGTGHRRLHSRPQPRGNSPIHDAKVKLQLAADDPRDEGERLAGQRQRSTVESMKSPWKRMKRILVD